jgi:heat shock protein HtpX
VAHSGSAAIAIIIAVAMIAVAWLLSIVIRLALSRQREYLADAGSIELTKNPDAMIAALRKIEGRGELEGAASAVMEMCIDNPRSGFSDLFATHPSIENRIESIVRYAGGRDPGPMALPGPEEQASAADGPDPLAPAGPWSSPGEPQASGDQPFLPPRPPRDADGTPAAEGEPGLSGPHRN